MSANAFGFEKALSINRLGDLSLLIDCSAHHCDSGLFEYIPAGFEMRLLGSKQRRDLLSLPDGKQFTPRLYLKLLNWTHGALRALVLRP